MEKIDCEANLKIARIIQVDVKRTLPEVKMLRNDRAQKALIRCLYLWHRKHPASGYVQGISDITVPFFLAFLNEYTPIDLSKVEQLTDIAPLEE